MMNYLISFVIIHVYQACCCSPIPENCHKPAKESDKRILFKNSGLYEIQKMLTKGQWKFNLELMESHNLTKKLISTEYKNNYELETIKAEDFSKKWKINDLESMSTSQCGFYSAIDKRNDKIPHDIVHNVCNDTLQQNYLGFTCTQLIRHSLVLKREYTGIRSESEIWTEAIEEVYDGCTMMYPKIIIMDSN